MEKVKVEVELGKEAHELAKMLSKIAKAVISAGQDGFQVADVVPIVQEAFAALSGDGMKDLKKLPEEIKQDPSKFALALVVEIDSVLDSFKL
jgi:hypothetical protein